jgi:H+/gluconate symporter-like permease
MSLGLIGIILSLILLITLVYRGMSVVLAAPLAAFFAMIMSGVPLLATYTEIFMPGLAGFIASYFPIFLTGAIFGVLMTVSGYAKDIATTLTGWLGPQRAMLATVLTGAVVTYGGISVFVAVFVLFPITRELFRQADIPRRLIPATIGLGIVTFTMTALPGAPQVQNIIPGQTFDTDTFAAPGLGLLAGVLIFGLGMFWLEFRKRQLFRKGEGFSDVTLLEKREGPGADVSIGQTASAPSRDEDSSADAAGTSNAAGESSQPRTSRTQTKALPEDLSAPNRFFPFIPLLVVIVVNFVVTFLIFPALDWSSLEDERFGGITVDDRAAIWAVLLALLSAILSILILHMKNMRLLMRGIADGTRQSFMPIFNTASEVGYGSVIASLAAFTIIRDGMFGLTQNALVTSALSTSVIAGITGSASGGMTIALNALGDDFRQLAIDQGISMEAMHRITALASGGLDTMPHNGFVVTLLLVCGMSHRESYKDLAMISLVIPVLVTVAMIPVVMTFGSF